MMNGEYDGMMGNDGWMMMWMLVWFLVVIAVLAVAVFAIVRWTRPRNESMDEAHQLLRRRFAAGEIDKDEYLSRQGDLGPPR